MGNKDQEQSDIVKININQLVFRIEAKDPGDFISYDETKCNGCNGCVMVCSANLWSLAENKKARLAPKYKELCMECAACHEICESDAIVFKYPSGGSGIIIKHG